ncbi:hypothetical protein SAMN02745229_03768 [Butyrivibrio fibrisolvens DSM 3071]|uniref:Uncharacterized protein n=1 Tax=Butyrivibrio fibrisolvens DSM 3071 TaxID=1121131 RepID=A0A1M6EQS6_BUTFI|nr:hypothetical protein [Butyrivibrio fibrisolvens]SHI87867.1 hypothetical protein SAMN02745229_03768 [Butyrivibrio fibrisolvens DSM 3071]
MRSLAFVFKKNTIAVIMMTVGLVVIIGIISSKTDWLSLKEYEPDNLIMLQDLEYGNRSFTCTGSTYDSEHDQIWVCNYGRIKNDSQEKLNPSVVCLNVDFEIQNEIFLKDLFETDNINLQGITWKNGDNTLFLAIGGV